MEVFYKRLKINGVVCKDCNMLGNFDIDASVKCLYFKHYPDVSEF